MDDVPEGGGAPTATVIADGVSNAIFPDISELDRAGGRVNLRKLHVSVQTADRDAYLGSNMIVAEPPADPNVSVTLFTTNDTFDTRVQAASRVESYLNKGGLWGGCLLDNHIAGQKSIQILQGVNSELPAVGQTLVLVENEGQPTAVTQYIRTTDVSFIVRTYESGDGKPIPMWVVTCKLSDSLRTDFTGTPGNVNASAAPTAARLRDTVVSDAGSYVGVSALKQAAALGDYTVNATSIFTQLVPSAQTETPISDVRTNGLSTALVASGGAVTQSISMGFTTAQNLFVGGPIYPGSLTVVRSGVTLTDAGGILRNGPTPVGTVDYDSGILALTTNVWGASTGTHVVTFIPAAVPELVSEQRVIRVTAGTRSLSYVLTMTDPPVPRTLAVSYLAQGRWYVLRDNGGGVLSGVSSDYGVGTINYTTGSISITLGALPDVGSAIVIQSYSKATTVTASNTELLNDGRVYVPINSDGLMSEERGSKAIAPKTLIVNWVNAGVAKYAIDAAGMGLLSGDATGTIDYAKGVIRISPATLPPSGTIFTLATAGSIYLAQIAEAPSDWLPVLAPSGALAPLPAPPAPVAVPLTVGGVAVDKLAKLSLNMTALLTTRHELIADYVVPGYPLSYYSEPSSRSGTLTDDGLGSVYLTEGDSRILWGSVNYATGELFLARWLQVPLQDRFGPVVPAGSAGANLTWNDAVALPQFAARSTRAISLVSYSGITVAHIDTPPLPPSPPPPLITIETPLTSCEVTGYVVRTTTVPNYTLKNANFSLGATRYQQLTDDTLLRDISPTTGGGTPAGFVSGPLATVFIASWTAGVTSQITDWRGVIAPPSVGVSAPFTGFSTVFRTATSPLRPASLSVLGTMQDGTPFNVTADANGKINGTRVKGRVDYQYGLVELYFVNPASALAYPVDLSFLSIPGVGMVPADLAMLGSLRYNAVGFSYLPLDATLLGIDPVRLPSDGRVPIFRPGGFAVTGHTGKITDTVTNGQTISCARVRLSRVRVVGQNGAVINAGYTTDLDAGTVTFTDVAGYSQPVTIEHRIEDMGVVRDVQISGEVTFTRPLTHDYPLGSFVSSALVAGDLKSRVSTLFDQTTWGNVWSGSAIGPVATGTYNAVASPLIVTNAGAVTERWALVFTNSTTFQVIGEHVGVIATGSTGTATSPINPVTSQPYFTVPALGWGTGWAAGNALRFDTVGAMAPVWVVRTVQQGPNTGTEHSFTLLSRGDVDRP